MARHRGPPSGSWRAFLANHGSEILACDFFLVPTATFQTLIGFVVMELGRRRIVALDVTAHPSAGWAATVVRRAVLAADGRARYQLRDRDAIYGDVFNVAVRGLGLRQVVTAYHAPLQNAHAERVIGTIRRECLDHMIVMGESHARKLLDEFVRYYNEERTHQALGPESPMPREEERLAIGEVISFPHLGGLHHSYAGLPERPLEVDPSLHSRGRGVLALPLGGPDRDGSVRTEPRSAPDCCSRSITRCANFASERADGVFGKHTWRIGWLALPSGLLGVGRVVMVIQLLSL